MTRSIILMVIISSFLTPLASANGDKALKTSDIKLDYGGIAPCIELTVEKVHYMTSSMASVTLKQVLKKPIKKCLRTSDDLTSPVTALAIDSAKNELLFYSYLNGQFPKSVGSTTRTELYLTSIPENLKLPISIIIKEEP